jgi:hypothetical protein
MARRDLSESRESLWLLTLGPAIWALHFTLSYLTAAIYCAKLAGPALFDPQPLGPVRLAIAAYTVLALLGIGWIGWHGLRRHNFGAARPPHDAPTAADRHRFLGFATLLLCGLSLVATLYVALPALFIGSCR